jgi:penicillin amidase
VIDDSLDSAQQVDAPAPVESKPLRRKRQRVLSVLKWASLALVAILVAAGLDGVWTVRASLPQYAGTLHLAGLSAPVSVYRDAQAIPQIYASDADDLFKAQGYVTAQDRFFEMDFRRHLTSARLSEMFGSSQVGTDKFLRTMGWHDVATQEWSVISAQSRRYLQDYADGVNAYLASKKTDQVSLEYSVMGVAVASGYRIAKWDPIDSLAWLKAMAWDLRGNMDDEITRSTLLASGLTRAQVESLYPAYPTKQNAPILTGGSVSGGTFSAPGSPAANADVVAAGAPGNAVLPAPRTSESALESVRAAIDRMPAPIGASLPGVGSNSFVISGALTATGKPILENDPHLSPSMPGVWYQIGLHCSCAFNAEGFSFSGVPGIIIGHNARIAWGFTNLNPDVSDLYLEKVKGNQYLVDGVWRDLAVHTETIKVAGGGSVKLTVRVTNNGPLISGLSDNLTVLGTKPAVDASGKPASTPGGAAVDPAAGTGYAVALKWTALQPGRTMDSLFALNQATDWTSFRAAVTDFAVPSQNIVYADVDGNIGYQAPGQIPIRGKGDGRWPAPGWDSAYDWKGFIPYAALPNELNPKQGYISTSNQQVIDPATYPYLLTGDWSNGYRSQRLADLIQAGAQAGRKITVADAQNMAFDNYSELARQLVPTMVQIPLTGAAAKAQNLLRTWDFQEPADGPAGTPQAARSAAAAYFETTWKHLLADTFDELPKANQANGDDRWWLVLTTLMAQPDSPWWDIKSTPTVETRDDIVARAMREAATGDASVMGSDPTGWRWGKLHTLTIQNQSFGVSGVGPVEWLFNVGPMPVSGGSAIVDANGWDPSHGFAVNTVPSMRMIVDMSNLDASRWIQLTGESGHAFSPHYTDQLSLWQRGQTLPMRWDPAIVKKAATDTMTLKP